VRRWAVLDHTEHETLTHLLLKLRRELTILQHGTAKGGDVLSNRD